MAKLHCIYKIDHHTDLIACLCNLATKSLTHGEWWFKDQVGEVSRNQSNYLSLNGCITITQFCTAHSLWSMACYTFFMGHIANFAIKMIQVSTKTLSWMQKCINSSGIFVFKIGQITKELFQLFNG